MAPHALSPKGKPSPDLQEDVPPSCTFPPYCLRRSFEACSLRMSKNIVKFSFRSPRGGVGFYDALRVRNFVVRCAKYRQVL